MDRSRVTLITVISALFLALIAYLASIIFSYPQTAEQESGKTPSQWGGSLDSEQSTQE